MGWHGRALILLSVKLPGLLLDVKPSEGLRVLDHVRHGGDVEFDASDLTVIQPVGACLLASAARATQRAGKRLILENWPPELKPLLEGLGCPIEWGRQQEAPGKPQGPTLALSLPNEAAANKAVNELSSRIAAFIPPEDRVAIDDHQGLRIYHAVQPALAHVLSELIDNVFSHARTVEFPTPMGWVAAQWYPQGDLVRVAVVDDGCGLLGSLRGHSPPPINHYDATILAFQPHVSSKAEPRIYAERRHLGLGLPISRDICRRLSGRIYGASGNALVMNPGLSNQTAQRLDPFFQGTIISLEFHRRVATVRTVSEIILSYTGTSNLRPRFDP
jgi:hypothetical protein